jgi:hypothetical protein
MAVTTINLSDPVSTWVNKTNTIATNVGDLATLSTTDTASLVAAINEINALVDGNLNDSSEIQGIFSAGSGLSYDNAGEYSIADSGVTGAMIDNDAIVERHIAAASIVNSHLSPGAVDTLALADGNVTNAKLADSSVSFAKIQADAIKSVNLFNTTTLLIKDSAATTLKTIYSPGS